MVRLLCKLDFAIAAGSAKSCPSFFIRCLRKIKILIFINQNTGRIFLHARRNSDTSTKDTFASRNI